ncbi:helix-turn-helix transcriptional regulator [Pararhodospirillum oryzae]|uniref:Transcriptional regulator n=1 Tax=Pararhodospirillum oryzae TaxID=478448 RepID=A0A512H940_9PROT|nr:helix-turn-helix transcriptional regulator [Pararhodospirillum oryzae]GEO81952.1 transcriptional regulator [Pararhodospirillum oryzae]
MQNDNLSPAQCRAGRALVGWSQQELCERAQVARKTLADFEAGKSTPYPRTAAAIRMALEAAGIEFIAENGGGAGVRFIRPTSTATAPLPD